MLSSQEEERFTTEKEELNKLLAITAAELDAIANRQRQEAEV